MSWLDEEIERLTRWRDAMPPGGDHGYNYDLALEVGWILPNGLRVTYTEGERSCAVFSRMGRFLSSHPVHDPTNPGPDLAAALERHS